MIGVIPPLLPYAFVAYEETALCLITLKSSASVQTFFRCGEIEEERMFSHCSFLLYHSLCESSYTNINVILNICLQ